MPATFRVVAFDKSDVKFKIQIAPLSSLQVFWRIVLFLAAIVVAGGISHWWYGGSWLVDITMFLIVLVIFAAWSKRDAERKEEITMTAVELQTWLVNGCLPWNKK